MESELSDSSATHIAKCLEKKKILKLRVCNYLGCQSQFDSRFNLRRHILLVHTKIRPFKCDLCEKRFGLNQHRLEHLTTHNLKEDTIQEIAEKKLTLRIFEDHTNTRRSYSSPFFTSLDEYSSSPLFLTFQNPRERLRAKELDRRFIVVLS
eukprot:CAMPEP_0115038732 /NCGR_PEP_ID=MMETSP0216-20121206/43593_1 /TAXON_ID=223996 /ORGANISM="Protocruzia adherens, Strain Boccale" /LENGTH=150 /DNA_ID=CAMNT_0002419207 /DNA_START=127 /DNA_END=575 /DNA_ORIENTATION=+